MHHVLCHLLYMKKLIGAFGFIASIFVLFIKVKTNHQQHFENWQALTFLFLFAGFCACIGSHAEQ